MEERERREAAEYKACSILSAFKFYSKSLVAARENLVRNL
jgi:hypothetical protein